MAQAWRDNPREVLAKKWAIGDLQWLLKPHRQTDLWNSLETWNRLHPHEFGPFVVNSHRRLGKSWTGLTYLTSRCLRKPGQICRFLPPSYKQGRLYVPDLMEQILQTCPRSLRPRQRGDSWIFENPRWPEDSAPSILEMVGVRDGGDSLRGPRANAVAMDEVREMENPRYIVNDILSYQFAGQEDPILLLMTTPPESMAHAFVTHFIPLAKELGTYLVFPVTDTWEADGNPDFTENDLKMVLSVVGEPGSVSWRREMLCELISDPESLIIPEFGQLKAKIVQLMPIPAWFDAYLAVDFGFQDYNGCLFAHIDFLTQQLVILDEVWMHNSSTGQLAEAIRSKEKALWAATTNAETRSRDTHRNPWRYRHLMRVGDHSKQQLVDLQFDHGIFVRETDKWDMEAALANLRHSFASDKIRIHPRCKQLILQLEHGTWKVSTDGSRRTFTRDAVLGHCDLIAALNYLHRMVSWQSNPYPMNMHGDPDRMYWQEDSERDRNESLRFKPMQFGPEERLT